MLLAALPQAVWSRINNEIVQMDSYTELEDTKNLHFSNDKQLQNYLEKHFSIDVIIQNLNNGAEFYLPPSSSDLDNTTQLSLQDVVRMTRQQATAIRALLSNGESTSSQVAALDSFFDELGFEAIREGGALLEAQENLFYKIPVNRISLPFRLESPKTSKYKYDRSKSYQDMQSMILLTHPTACLGQEILHKSVIVMFDTVEDEMFGLVVNKPWESRSGTMENCVLKDVIQPDEIAIFNEDTDESVRSILNVPLFLGGPDQTSLMVLHEVEEDGEDQDDQRDEVDEVGEVDGGVDEVEKVDEVDEVDEVGDEDTKEEKPVAYDFRKDSELLIGTTGKLRLTLVEKVLDLRKMIQQNFIDPKRCKLFVGLCVWNRDQLGTELERNVWIRTKSTNRNTISDIGLCVEKNLDLFNRKEEDSTNTKRSNFTDDFWRGSVAQLGEPYEDIALTIETDHSILLQHLGDQVEDRAKRMIGRFEEKLFKSVDGEEEV
jgi:putative AlgH/UPF0301 family transcriptional regulator